MIKMIYLLKPWMDKISPPTLQQMQQIQVCFPNIPVFADLTVVNKQTRQSTQKQNF